MFGLLQSSSWWLCMPSPFLALYFGDLFRTGLRMAIKTHVPAPYWNLQLDIKGDSAEDQLLEICLSLYWWDLSQLARLSLCMFFLLLVLSLPFLTSDPHWYKKCLSDVWVDQEETEAHRCLSLFVIHPPALLADAMWVHPSFLEQRVLKNWVKASCRYRITDTRAHTAFVFHSELGSG